MIIAKSPMNICFFGEGTDHPDFFGLYGGTTLSASINRYVYVMIRFREPFAKTKYRIVSDIIEEVDRVEDIASKTIKNILNQFYAVKSYDDKLEIVITSDLPYNESLGYAAALSNALVYGLSVLFNQENNQFKTGRNAYLYTIKETDYSLFLGNYGASAVGGFNHMHINKDGLMVVKTEYPTGMEKGVYGLRKRLLLFWVSTKKSKGIIERDNDILHEIKELAYDGICHSDNDSHPYFGELLERNWKLKQKLIKEDVSMVNKLVYHKAKISGATGGTLLGLGDIFLIYAEPEYHQKIRKELVDYPSIAFEFENKGTHILRNTNESTFERYENIEPV